MIDPTSVLKAISNEYAKIVAKRAALLTEIACCDARLDMLEIMRWRFEDFVKDSLAVTSVAPAGEVAS